MVVLEQSVELLSRETEILWENLPHCRLFFHDKSTWREPGSNLGPRVGKATANRLSYSHKYWLSKVFNIRGWDMMLIRKVIITMRTSTLSREADIITRNFLFLEPLCQLSCLHYLHYSDSEKYSYIVYNAHALIISAYPFLILSFDIIASLKNSVIILYKLYLSFYRSL
jgi:hypothetical protein